jgi:two-component system response regulator AtoC
MVTLAGSEAPFPTVRVLSAGWFVTQQLVPEQVCRVATRDDREESNVELAVEAMKRGADDYIAKGRMQIDELEMRIGRALRQQHLEAENVSLHRQLDAKFGLENLVGESPAMREVLEMVRQVAPSRATILLQGESGTGKERIAQAIHQLSPRCRQPLVAVHCAQLAPTLLESELFGHEKGAFTGAYERRIGRF